MTSVAVLQPSWLPWLGYFDLIDRVDVFVLYDNVQFDKHGWRNRNRIKTASGEQWLTVPVRHGGRFGQTVGDVEIDGQGGWQKKHRASIVQNYRRAPFFEAYWPELDGLLSQPWPQLAPLNLGFIRMACRWLGITTPIVPASELSVAGDRNQRLVALCAALGASHFVSTDAARAYLDLGLFGAQGVSVEWQSYRHPVYRQLYGDFISHLSVIDLLFNHGPASLAIIRRGRDA